MARVVVRVKLSVEGRVRVRVMVRVKLSVEVRVRVRVMVRVRVKVITNPLDRSLGHRSSQ
jgi:hypothetical protein